MKKIKKEILVEIQIGGGGSAGSAPRKPLFSNKIT